ncbi:group I intron-associated PD-(D/E)XK endonuclease [Halovivax sp.]|uniref:group I intron-associated PD-(D/E)XK endonuclease n=1 Tax=Halovivax sp. TaxID=1935978 RepID=UPI0025B83783|nr:group I intron-associated PD-(D/E)XK endonuclease [Halovivax sp.]
MIDRVERYESLERSQKRGYATEAIVTVAFALHDIPVFVPTSEEESCDMVVGIAGRFRPIRCATAYRKSPGTVPFETAGGRRRAGSDRRGYDGRAPLFAVYDPINDYRYLMPAEEATSETMEIRFREARNGQRVGGNWYEDYLFCEQLARMKGGSVYGGDGEGRGWNRQIDIDGAGYFSP